MRQKWLKLKRINGGLQRYWKLSVVSFLVLGEAIASSGNYAWGQIASDNTLGSESSLVTSPIPGAFLIEGGATRGTNLFHSFSEFSVPTLGIAYFNNVGAIPTRCLTVMLFGQICVQLFKPLKLTPFLNKVHCLLTPR
jgi:hypothetical protein